MLRPLTKYLLLEYEKPEDFVDVGGLFVASEHLQRDFIRKKDRKVFTADAPPPDMYKWGKLIEGESCAPIGSMVYFNKHDAHEVLEGEKFFYLLPKEHALCYTES